MVPPTCSAVDRLSAPTVSVSATQQRSRGPPALRVPDMPFEVNESHLLKYFAMFKPVRAYRSDPEDEAFCSLLTKLLKKATTTADMLEQEKRLRVQVLAMRSLLKIEWVVEFSNAVYRQRAATILTVGVLTYGGKW